MTAHELFQLLVGEIGIERNVFYYELRWWEVKSIVRGYRKRSRTFCTMLRWSTFMQMNTGMADLKKAGIYEPQDLIKFPWETEEKQPEEQWTDEDIQREREWLIAKNKEYSEKSGNP